MPPINFNKLSISKAWAAVGNQANKVKSRVRARRIVSKFDKLESTFVKSNQKPDDLHAQDPTKVGLRQPVDKFTNKLLAISSSLAAYSAGGIANIPLLAYKAGTEPTLLDPADRTYLVGEAQVGDKGVTKLDAEKSRYHGEGILLGPFPTCKETYKMSTAEDGTKRYELTTEMLHGDKITEIVEERNGVLHTLQA